MTKRQILSGQVVLCQRNPLNKHCCCLQALSVTMRNLDARSSISCLVLSDSYQVRQAVQFSLNICLPLVVSIDTVREFKTTERAECVIQIFLQLLMWVLLYLCMQFIISTHDGAAAPLYQPLCSFMTSTFSSVKNKILFFRSSGSVNANTYQSLSQKHSKKPKQQQSSAMMRSVRSLYLLLY